MMGPTAPEQTSQRHFRPSRQVKGAHASQVLDSAAASASRGCGRRIMVAYEKPGAWNHHAGRITARRRAGSTKRSRRRSRSRPSGGPSRRSRAGPSSASTPPRTSRRSTTRATSADPGEFPYTRGIHPTGYRGKLWTMRQFAGFGTPEETNERYKQLLAAGGTGLSVAFDLPTLMGRDPDHELSLGEVGKCGVSVTSLADMETLFDGIPLGDITTSMTINSPAAMIFAMYLVVAEQQGATGRRCRARFRTTSSRSSSRRRNTSTRRGRRCGSSPTSSRSASTEVPQWNTISVSGYHIREAGATAAQELAFTLRDGIEYVQWGVDAGLDVDAFVPRISFFFNAHSDFFEEIAKYRAARRIWAHVMRDRFGAKDERSWKLRFHTPDGRRVADRAAAVQQRRPHRAAGAVGGARRHQLAAHQLARRGAGAADRGGGDAGAAHAADHRPRKRRRQRRRSARRLVLRREADARHGGRGARLLRRDRRDGRHGRGDRARLPAAGDRRELRTASSRRSSARRRSSSASTRSCRRTSRRSRFSTSTRRAAETQMAQARALRRERDSDGRARARSTRCARGAARHREPDAAAPRRRPRLRDASARCATRCARCGASTKRCRSI